MTDTWKRPRRNPHRGGVHRGPRGPVEPIGDITDRHSLEFHIAEFLEWSAVRGFAETTIATRKRELDRLHRWLTERGVTRTSEVTKPMMDRYQRWLFHYRKANGQPLTFLTQKNRLMPLRTFFSWATRTNRILYNPAADIELPRVEHRLPAAVLTTTEVETVLCGPDLGDPLGVRDRAILELFYATGIRRAEMLRVRLFDFDFERRALSIRQGKGKRDRTVPVTERAMAWVLRYLTDVRPRLVMEPDGGWLFLTFDGEPLAPLTLSYIARRYVQMADVGKSGSCHLFRHTIATLLLEAGVDIRWIQALLGHANLTSTQIYTRVSVSALGAIVDAAHPGATNHRNRDLGLDDDEIGDDPGFPDPVEAAALLAALEAEGDLEHDDRDLVDEPGWDPDDVTAAGGRGAKTTLGWAQGRNRSAPT
jgi:integrase/recombinase XerD